MPARRPLRRAGTLLSISSLPSRFGIGDLGQSADRFLDWLRAARQSYWQILPLTIPDSVGSPYASPSMMAANWLLLSPELLVRDGWLSRQIIPRRPPSSTPIQYRLVSQNKQRLFKQAFRQFQTKATPAQRRSWQQFVQRESRWLEPAAWFLALKDAHRGWAWWRWPAALQSWPLSSAVRQGRWRWRYEYHTWLQWQFDRQWQDLVSRAHQRGVQFIGDMPFAPPLDSVEIWSRPELFLLNKRRQPVAVFGVPPDAFAKGGQRWGNPAYRWSGHRADGWRWWRDRFRLAARRFDVIRFDHFRGLAATWHIPGHEQNPAIGHWVASPGREILRQWRAIHRGIMIAEDLGQFSPVAERLRRRWRLDGMRVWQFGWSGLPDNFHHPRYLRPDVFYYTSTHDTNTTLGWWREDARPYERQHVRNWHQSIKAINWMAITDAFSGPVDGIIVPIQDYLGLGSKARLNRPGRTRGNWRWRVAFDGLTPALAGRIRRLVMSNDRHA